MTEQDIKLYLQLNKQSKYVPMLWGVVLLVVVLNMLFSFIPSLEIGVSIVVAPLLAVFFIQSLFGESQNAKALALINKLVNSNPEALKKIKEFKSA